MSGRRRNELNSNDAGDNSSPPPPSYEEVYQNEQHSSMMSQIDLNENNPVPMPVRPNSTTSPSQQSGHSSFSTTSQGPNIFTSYDDAHPHDNIYAGKPSSNRPSNRPSNSNSNSNSQGTSQGQQARLPWVYPQGYFCKKCRNTGTKIKNGKSCKDCWRRFAPIYNSSRPDATILMGYVPFAQNTFQPGYQQTMYMSGYGPPQPPPFPPSSSSFQQPPNKPMIVQPGDPRLGGIQCGECRGSGRLKNFLDWKLCPSCNGVGRVRC